MNMAQISSSYDIKSAPAFGSLVMLIGLTILFGTFAGMFFVPLTNLVVQDEILRKLLSGIWISLFSFLLPPVVLRAYFRAKRLPFFVDFTRPKLSVGKAGKAVVLLLLMLPPVSLLGWVMAQVQIPDALKPIQDAVEKETLMLLGESRPAGVLLVALFLTVVAPFSEEYFFRGGLMGWLVSRSGKSHVWVWVVALVFSLVHFEWTGLLARLLMGAVLGYVALYGGIPMAVLLHALNNLFVFVIYKTTGLQDLFMGDPVSATAGQLLFVVSTTLVTLPTLFYLIRNLKRTLEEK